MTARTLTLGSTSYPVVLPNIRDPRLHVASVIITIHVLGQVALGFQVSIPQILAAILTCAVIEIGITFYQTRSIVWPASAMLTGSGVALILRVVGTPPDDHWTTYAWEVFAIVAAASLLSKYVIKYRGSNVFNPSNIGLVVTFIVLGSSRVEPLDFWWGPLDPAMLLAYAVILGGGLLITRRLKLLVLAAIVLGRSRSRPRRARRVRPLHDGQLGLRACVRRRLLARHRHVARDDDLPVLHDHGPQDGARRASRARDLWRARGGRQRPWHGHPERRVRDEGGAAGRTRGAVRRATDPRSLHPGQGRGRRPGGALRAARVARRSGHGPPATTCWRRSPRPASRC